MCCEETKEVSEDIRVIHDELEKADTWIFAAQEILRPENEEFDPDIKDIKNIETVLYIAIENIKEAISLCEIYRGKEDDVPKNTQKTLDKKAHMVRMLNDLNAPEKYDRENKLKAVQMEISEIEKRLQYLKANINVERIKLTPEELQIYKR
jgi:hypothetical protein